jgi:hypothetical protein
MRRVAGYMFGYMFGYMKQQAPSMIDISILMYQSLVTGAGVLRDMGDECAVGAVDAVDAGRYGR